MIEDDPTERTNKSDAGCVRMLLEGKYLFDVIDLEAGFSNYKIIILPDNIPSFPELNEKLKVFLNNGGKILATGISGINKQTNEFIFNFGAKYIGENELNPDYFRPLFELDCLSNTGFVFYSKGQKIQLTDGVELGKRENLYFNRTTFHFCSHQHTPNSGEYGGAGMVEGKDGIYIAWDVFSDYATNGSLILKKVFCYALDRLLGKNKTLSTNLLAQGIVTLMEQKGQNRLINHILYVSPVKRGNDVEIIEDILPVYHTGVSVKTDKEIKNILLIPQNEKIKFDVKNDVVTYYIDKFECHQMVVLEY